MAMRASFLSISGCLKAPWCRGMNCILVCLKHRDPELQSETSPTVSSYPSYIKTSKAGVGHWNIISHSLLSCLIIKFNTLIRHLAPRAVLNFSWNHSVWPQLLSVGVNSADSPLSGWRNSHHLSPYPQTIIPSSGLPTNENVLSESTLFHPVRML